MKKVFILLAFLAFTISVKADYAPIDIQIAEGEEYQIDQIVAAQVINQTSWDGQYILTGGVARIYIDFLPREWPDGRQNILFERFYVQEQPGGGWWLYHEGHGGANPATVTFDSPYDAYQWLISDEGVIYCGQWMATQDDEDGLGEYLDTSTMSTVGYRNSSSSNDADWVLEYNQQSLATMLNREQFLKKTDILNYSQVPINGVKITITNSTGQTVNQIDYTSYLLNIQSLLGQVNSNLTDIQNALGFSGVGMDNLANFLGQWRTTDGITQAEILNALTNLTDYTDYLKYYIDTSNSTNLSGLVWLYNWISKNVGTGNSSYAGLLSRAQANFLYGSSYDTAFNQLLTDFRNNFYKDNPSLFATSLALQFKDYYLSEGREFIQAQRLTNIVDAVSLGRDWLNLATNDLNSFTYWLNQQNFSSGASGTNAPNNAQMRFDAITNQYAQISLVGANASNTAENWDYFKRLEMLLAALVYKEPSEGEKLSDDLSGRDSVADEAKSEISNSLDTLLDSFSGSSNLLDTHGQSFISALNSITDIFDRQWRPAIWRYYKDGQEEEPAAKGPSGSNFELYIDFTDSKWQYVFDFIRNVCGFAWSLMSILLIYRFSILTYRLVMRFARVCYSILRHMFG